MIGWKTDCQFTDWLKKKTANSEKSVTALWLVEKQTVNSEKVQKLTDWLVTLKLQQFAVNYLMYTVNL